MVYPLCRLGLLTSGGFQVGAAQSLQGRVMKTVLSGENPSRKCLLAVDMERNGIYFLAIMLIISLLTVAKH